MDLGTRCWWGCAVVIVGAAIAATACGGGDSTAACTPGVSIACTCSNGNTGAQVCAADGSGYGVCACSSTGSAGDRAGQGGAGGASGGSIGIAGAAGNIGSPGAAGRGGSGVAGSSQAGTGGSARPTWTILIYANGDNNIGPELFADMVEMVSANLSADIGVYVYADFVGGDPIPGTNDLFPTGTEIDRIIGNGNAQTISTKAEEDFDNPNVLSEAVRSTFAAHPADRYGLILWDHGGAWKYGFGGDTQNGTRTSFSSMSFESLAGAVRSGLSAANVKGTQPLEFVAFDTCLLGSPEVASAFKDLAKTYIANAEVDYGNGWDYQATLSWLSSHASASATDFAKQEVAVWNAHHGSGDLDMLFKSHMALDTAALSGFSTAISSLVTAVRANGGAVSAARSFDTALPDYYVENVDDDGFAPLSLKDVGQVLATLAQDPNSQISTAATAARSSLNSLVLAKANGAARGSQAGLNIGAGVPLEFDASMSGVYRQLTPTWNASAHWADLLDFVRAAADATGPTISSTGFAGNALPFRIDDADLLSTDFNLWSVSDDSRYLTLLQLVNRFYINPGSYQFTWTGNVVAIAATPNPVLVMLLPWREISGTNGVQLPIFKALGLIEAPSGTYYVELLVDRANLVADVAIVTVNGQSQIFQVADLAGSDVVFWPLFVYADTTTGVFDVTTGPTGLTLPAGSLAFTTAAPAAGSYGFTLEAKDIWGNQTTKLFPFTVR